MSDQRSRAWEQIARASQETHLAAVSRIDEMRRTFRTPSSRHRFLERLRFPDGFVCASCRRPGEPERPQPGVLRCTGCERVLDIRSETLFEDDSIPLGRWFDVFWLLASGERVLDPPLLQGLLALPPEGDARRALTRLRRVVAYAERTPLEGTVEVDGRVVHLRAVHALVLCAVEDRGHAGGRVRLAQAQNLSADAVQRFVERTVKRGSTVRTDCWTGYVRLEGYLHQVEKPTMAPARLALVDAASDRLHAWLRSCSIRNAEELRPHLDEFVLRRNRLHGGRSGEIFCQLLADALDPASLRGRRRERLVQSGVRAVGGGESQGGSSAASA